MNDSGATRPCDFCCSRSSPIAAAAFSPSSTSPGSSSTRPAGARPGFGCFVTPDAGITVGLQLDAHRTLVRVAGERRALERACQVLNVMPDFMREHVGLREIAGRAELPMEIVEEAEVEIDLAVARAIERARSPSSTTRTPIECESRNSTGTRRLVVRQFLRPRVLDVAHRRRRRSRPFFLPRAMNRRALGDDIGGAAPLCRQRRTG